MILYKSHSTEVALNNAYSNPITRWIFICDYLNLTNCSYRIVCGLLYGDKYCCSKNCGLKTGKKFIRNINYQFELSAGIKSIVNDPYLNDDNWCWVCGVALFTHY